MATSKFDESSEYFSGQGVMMVGLRVAGGAPAFYDTVGNVSSLKCSIAASSLDHKGAQDGQRATDKRINTEIKGTVSAVVQSWSPKNLALAIRGAYALTPAGVSAAETLYAYPGKITPLAKLSVANVVMTQNAVVLDQYVNDATAWDYKNNLEAGSIKWNDGSVTSISKLGIVVTAVAVGATTQITVPNTCVVGDTVAFNGFTGADAAVLNGKQALVTVASSTSVTVALNTTGKVITTGAVSKMTMTGMLVSAVYDNGAHYLVGALTQPITEVSIRFEGLNTANGNSPVVVDVYKMSVDPLKELALISDTFGEFMLDGAMLADSTRSSGSKFFSYRKV